MARMAVTRRGLLLGGGAGIGLVVAWALWPRRYPVNFVANTGETVMGAFLKIGEDGHVTVVVPQAEMGQGVWTALPQALADELGADWRTVAVEPAPISPNYANTLLADEIAGEEAQHLAGLQRWIAREMAVRESLMITAGSTSIRGFESRFREAGALARAQLCAAAAKRWRIDPGACDTEAGFVVRRPDRLRFAELAAEAAALPPPANVELRRPGAGGLSGRPMARLDFPAKTDGSIRYAGDVRVPDMVFASVRHGPVGDTVLDSTSPEGAQHIPGLIAIIDEKRFTAAVGQTWWAANRALDLIRPTFQTDGALPDDASIAHALHAALATPGTVVHEAGDTAAPAAGRGVVREYETGFAPHAAIEPLCATARVGEGGCEVWAPAQAPGLMRDAVARALGLPPTGVTLYPMPVGGGFGAKLEVDAAVEAALIARKMGRPVQLTWSREEDTRADRMRPPARARLAATLTPDNRIARWQAAVAMPAATRTLWNRLAPGLPGGGGEDALDPAALAGAVPAYAVPALSVAHHPAAIGVPTGAWRGGADVLTAFFNECFVDELAHEAGQEPVSFRMAMLGGAPRLARVLEAAASLGSWNGGAPGSGQGIAAHACVGSFAAVVAQVRMEDGRLRVDRLAAAVDCGRLVNPDIVREQVESGLVWGLAGALGTPIRYAGGLVQAGNFHQLGLPRMADCPQIDVQLILSADPPGGAGETAVPPVGPAIANALFALNGRRVRRLPLGV